MCRKCITGESAQQISLKNKRDLPDLTVSELVDCLQRVQRTSIQDGVNFDLKDLFGTHLAHVMPAGAGNAPGADVHVVLSMQEPAAVHVRFQAVYVNGDFSFVCDCVIGPQNEQLLTTWYLGVIPYMLYTFHVSALVILERK